MEPHETWLLHSKPTTSQPQTTACLLRRLQEAEGADDPELMVKLLGTAFRSAETAMYAEKSGKSGDAKFYLGARLQTARLDKDHWDESEPGQVMVSAMPHKLGKKGEHPNLITTWCFDHGLLDRATLRKGYLYLSHNEDLVSTEFVHMLATTRYRSVLGTLTAQAILHEAFDAVYTRYWIEIGCKFLRLLALMITSSYRTKQSGADDGAVHLFIQAVCLILLYGITIKDFISHTFKAYVLGMSAYIRFDTWQLLVDALRAYTMILYMYHLVTCSESCDRRGETVYSDVAGNEDFDRVAKETLHGLLGSWVVMEWLMCLWALRGLRMIGPKMLPVLKATTGAGGFWIVLIFVMAAAINYYYIVAPDPIRQSFAESFHVVVKFVFFGDPFDIDTTDDETYAYLRQSDGNATGIQLIRATQRDPLIRNLRRALTIGAFFAVILMNIFIAILSQNYEQALEEAECNFLHHRALIIVELSAIRWWSRGLKCPGYILVLSPDPLEELQTTAASHVANDIDAGTGTSQVHQLDGQDASKAVTLMQEMMEGMITKMHEEQRQSLEVMLASIQQGNGKGTDAFKSEKGSAKGEVGSRDDVTKAVTRKKIRKVKMGSSDSVSPSSLARPSAFGAAADGDMPASPKVSPPDQRLSSNSAVVASETVIGKATEDEHNGLLR